MLINIFFSAGMGCYLPATHPKFLDMTKWIVYIHCVVYYLDETRQHLFSLQRTNNNYFHWLVRRNRNRIFYHHIPWRINAIVYGNYTYFYLLLIYLLIYTATFLIHIYHFAVLLLSFRMKKEIECVLSILLQFPLSEPLLRDKK